jgi:large subunit ribosomal protein L30
MDSLKITLKRSVIGRSVKHRKIIRALGLKKINQSVIHNDTPSIRGMVQRVKHMLDIEQVKRTKSIQKDTAEKVENQEKTG